MSDTTSFLGGAALAGLAALIVLRGGVNFGSVVPGQSPGQSSPLLPMPPMAIPGMGTSGMMGTVPGMPATGTGLILPTPGSIVANAPTSNGEKTYEDAKQRIELDQIKSQLEQQQSQIRSQQALIDALTAQTRTAGLNPVAPAMVPQMSQLPNTPLQNGGHDASFVSGLPWALGGVLLTFGGGIAVVGMFSMLSRQNGRPTRTVEYVHDDYPAYLPQRRRVQSLPPRRTVRRVDLEDED